MDAIGNQSASSWWLSLFSQLQQLHTSSEETLTSENCLSFEQLLAQIQQQGMKFSQSEESLAAIEAQINSSLVALDSSGLQEELQSITNIELLADTQVAEANAKGSLSFTELSSELRDLKQALMAGPIKDTNTSLNAFKTTPLHGQQKIFSDIPHSQIAQQVGNNPLNTLPASENQSEFFYRFAAAPGLSEGFKPIKGFQQNAFTVDKKFKLDNISQLGVSSLAQFDAHSEGEIEREVRALRAGADSSNKPDSQVQLMISQQSGGEEAKASNFDLGSELRKDSGLQELLKLKLQDPNLRAHLGSKVADRIQIMQQQGIQHARIQLDPPELGQLDIRLQFHQDQLQVNVMSQVPQVRDALEGHSIRLREMLEQQGVELTDLQFFDESEKEHPAFAGGDWGEDGQQDEDHLDNLAKTPSGDSEGVSAEELSAVKTLASVLRLDVFV